MVELIPDRLWDPLAQREAAEEPVAWPLWGFELGVGGGSFLHRPCLSALTPCSTVGQYGKYFSRAISLLINSFKGLVFRRSAFVEKKRNPKQTHTQM